MIGILSIATFGLASAEINACAQEIRMDRERTIRSFINESESIAIYVVDDVRQLDDSIYLRSESYEYSMRRALSIKGSGAERIQVIGYEPYDQTPQHYFGLNDIYRSLGPDSSLMFGGSAWTEGVSNECEIAPRFLVGYSYIVFDSEYLSRASYEPTLHFRANPWLRLITEITNE